MVMVYILMLQQTHLPLHLHGGGHDTHVEESQYTVKLLRFLKFFVIVSNFERNICASMHAWHGFI